MALLRTASVLPPSVPLAFAVAPGRTVPCLPHPAALPPPAVPATRRMSHPSEWDDGPQDGGFDLDEPPLPYWAPNAAYVAALPVMALGVPWHEAPTIVGLSALFVGLAWGAEAPRWLAFPFAAVVGGTMMPGGDVSNVFVLAALVATLTAVVEEQSVDWETGAAQDLAALAAESDVPGAADLGNWDDRLARRFEGGPADDR